VLQVLFAADTQAEDPMDTFELMEGHFSADPEDLLKLGRVMMDYARDLVDEVSREKEILDKLISSVSLHWKLSRINRVDRNILRMAIAEMIRFPETPGKVILNEAIELAKDYGEENSAAFINGILDRIHAIEERPASTAELHKILTSLDESETTG
jgi:transcription antitermination protein NusB